VDEVPRPGRVPGVRLDVFPAVIRIAPPGTLGDPTALTASGDAPPGTRRLDRCRAVVRDGTLLVAVDSPEGPELVFRERVESVTGRRAPFHIVTSSGKTVVVVQDRNCGCGSRLRSWSPGGSVVASSEDPSR